MSSPNQKTSVPNGENMDPNGGSQSPIGKFASFGRRLQSAAEKKKFNQAGLAKELGLTSGTFSRYWNGERLPPADTLIDVAEVLDVSPRWLIRGTESSVPVDLPNDLKKSKAPDDDTVEIAWIDLRFGLGGALMDEEVSEQQVEMRRFSRSWLRQISSSPSSMLYWAVGKGNSMEPAISDGDLILIDRSINSLDFGDLYWACAYGQTGMVKRLRPMPDGSVKILSDNPNVPPEIAYDGELHIFGRVIVVVRKI